MKGKYPFLLVFLCIGVVAWTQVTSDFTLSANPTLNIPLGPSLSDDTPYYTLGGGISLRGEYTLPFAPTFYAGVVLDADFMPINNASESLMVLSLGPEIGVQYFLAPRFGVKLAGYGGMYMGAVQEGTVFNPFAGGIFDVGYLVSPSMSIGAGASFKYLFTPSGAVYQGIGVSLGVQYHIGASSGGEGKLRIEPEVRPIFPLLYGWYDKNPAGTLTIKNTAKGPVQNVTVSFLVKQFMDAPKVSWQWKELARDEEKTFDVFALFTDSIFQVTEATKVAGEIIVSYTYLGSDVTSRYPVTVVINNRNAMTWDDTGKAAAFVTTNDVNVRGFIARAVPDARSRGKPAINMSFRSAMALFEAMNVHGVAYIPDPNASFAEKIANKTAVDYLQFPAQTLDIKAGDCDDLSILYAALLEAAGIQTAFLTVPGHIYVAFSLGMDPDTAKSTFGDTDDLIVRGDRTWVPVEITRVKDGFLKAWKTGAQEWRAAMANKTAGFCDVHASWEKYAPANTGDRLKVAITQPDSNKVWTAYGKEIGRFFTAELQPRAAKIQADLKAKNDDPKLLNRLGVLYARFGMLDEAGQQFNSIVKSGGEVPSALINLGNISFLAGSNREAMSFYKRALAKAPRSSIALQGIVKAGYELGKTDEVEKALAALKDTDPGAAASLASMGSEGAGSGRAASMDKEITTWKED